MRNRLLAGAGALVLALASGCAGRRAPAAPGPPPSGIEEGLASWYGVDEAGRATASGEIMDPERFTAAHRSLPFGSLVRVTDLQTGKEVDVIVNDRGPHVSGRIIDLSFAAARKLDLVNRGVTPVRLRVIGLEGPLAERRWRVQVGSFAEPGRAKETATLLQAEGYSPVFVSSFQDGAQILYRVWVGEYRERDGAERLARELTRDGHTGFAVLGAVSAY